MRALFIQIVIYALLFPGSVLARSYYISVVGDDVNDGSIDTPWKTLAMVSAAGDTDDNGGFILPGDTLFFRAGDAFEGNLLFKRSGSREEPIVFGSYGDGEKPVISGSGDIPGGDYFEAVRLVNASHIIITDLWIKNNRQDGSRYTWGSNSSYGIYVYANKWGGVSGNLTFKNLKVSDVYSVDQDVDFKKMKVAGIRLASDSSEMDIEVAIKDVLVEDCYFTHTGKSGVWTTHQKASKTIDSLNRNMNIVIRNNTFFQTGGSGVILASVYNALIENNDFDHTGYSNDTEPRLAGRGSGAWVFSSRHVIAQYNRSYSVRGPGDSYGMHIDFGNRNVLFQYNYSEDSEGGFCEILGDNINSTYRFNVSVNDGFRDFHGYSVWLSGFAGSGNDPIPSDSNFVYNNTIYLDSPDCRPDISIFARNSFIYNNIFHATDGAEIGADGVEIDIEEGSQLAMANNLFYGNISDHFTNLDDSKITDQDPLFVNPDPTAGKDGFNIQAGSPVINAGTTFPEPNFPMVGKGIFKDITSYASTDAFGNGVDLKSVLPNMGASNAFNSNQQLGRASNRMELDNSMIYPNPVSHILHITLGHPDLPSAVSIFDVTGKLIHTTFEHSGERNMQIQMPSGTRNGIYFLKIAQGEYSRTSPFVLHRDSGTSN
ncbi:MAG: T9SS type A sorting domain-containing protein [Bacteroidetes bacterium]|nr:T9SS type A sorting domain-containing protein [Bacteroidota bacterium]